MNELKAVLPGREGFVYFWEVLTGVFDDNRSRILRIVSLVLLFLGCAWAALNYIKAGRLANIDDEAATGIAKTVRGRNEALESLKAAAQAVGSIRRGSEAIAYAMTNMNTSPFNIEGYDEFGLEDLSSTGRHLDEAEAGAGTLYGTGTDAVSEVEETRQELHIKALMVSGKTRYAVIDYGGELGKVIHQGQELPDGSRVVRITAEGITIRSSGRELTYTVQ